MVQNEGVAVDVSECGGGDAVIGDAECDPRVVFLKAYGAVDEPVVVGVGPSGGIPADCHPVDLRQGGLDAECP